MVSIFKNIIHLYPTSTPPNHHHSPSPHSDQNINSEYMTLHKQTLLGRPSNKDISDAKIGFIKQILTKKQLNKSVREEYQLEKSSITEKDDQQQLLVSKLENTQIIKLMQKQIKINSKEQRKSYEKLMIHGVLSIVDTAVQE